MNEAEWLACTNPWAMLEFLGTTVSERKLRLFAVACVRRYAAVHAVMHQLIQVSELYADGLANWNDLALVRKMTKGFQRQAMQQDVGMGAGAVRNAATVAHPSAVEAAQGVLHAVVPDVAIRAIGEIIGNPFRATTIDRSGFACNDGRVRNVARAIYDSRAFEELPVLADALEETGCTDAVLLGHLRAPGPHWRGCFGLDAILGRE